jgi:hypothetical protein
LHANAPDRLLDYWVKIFAPSVKEEFLRRAASEGRMDAAQEHFAKIQSLKSRQSDAQSAAELARIQRADVTLYLRFVQEEASSLIQSLSPVRLFRPFPLVYLSRQATRRESDAGLAY